MPAESGPLRLISGRWSFIVMIATAMTQTCVSVALVVEMVSERGMEDGSSAVLR